MAKSKRNKLNNGESKRGHYKRDHSYIDLSDLDDGDGLYEDDHISIKSTSSEEEEGAYNSSDDKEEENKEEDFISLVTEVDDRCRQQRRFEERKELKRKRVDEDESNDAWESEICYPWMELTNSIRLRQPVSASRLLQREAKCFIQYLEPTLIEIKLREYLVHRIRTAITGQWLEATVEVFGSFSTELYLPNSDIDLVVSFPPSQQIRLRRLAQCLELQEICRDAQIIEGATVPVIKFEDVMTKLKVDIILNSTSGLDSAGIIRDMTDTYPVLRPICLIVKHLLALRNLNEVYTGGLGGYAIVCLVYSFLQMHPKVASAQIDPREMDNLGVLLLDFFQLYGMNFNLDVVGIDVRRNGSYYDKSHIVDRNGRPVFSIKDPQDYSNDIGSKSYNSMSVVRGFRFAYLSMTRKAFELESELKRNNFRQLDQKTLDSHKKSSILGSFIHISAEFMRQRELMNDVYTERRWQGQEAAETFSFDV